MGDPDRANFAALSGAVLGGLLIWAAHFAIVYGITGVACTRGFANSSLLGIGVLQLSILAVTVLALFGAAVVLLQAVRVAKRSDGGSGQFLGWMAAMAAVLALVAIAWGGLPAVLVPGCQ